MIRRVPRTFSRIGRLAVGVAPLVGLLAGSGVSQAVEPQEALEKAVNYLASEIPRWYRENRCYSCHNNGDAVRALTAAARAGLLPKTEPLADTLGFLRSPDAWDANGPDGPFKDEKLANIQFAAALADATDRGLIEDRSPLIAAARRLAELQREDGSWPSDAAGTIGSPVTYGEPLATAISLRTLQLADPREFAGQIEQGQAWFAAREPRNLLDASAVLLALGKIKSTQSDLRRQQALKLIRAGQSTDGGWGPFVNAPPDVFDTAIVLISLKTEKAQRTLAKDVATLIERGRAYLRSQQNADGSWPATTRPPGVDSYAQQVSTSGWALQALLATGAESRKNSAATGPEKCK